MKEKSTEFGSWTLSEIIEGRYFRVPDYQRGYAWGERQVAEFWEDLCAIVAAGARHYTGAITVEAFGGASEIAPRKGFAIVDGQQRLTTIAILFSALKLESNPLLVKAEGGDNYVFSYGANNDDQQFLRRILSGDEPDAPENSHQRNLGNALGFFQSMVERLDADQRRKIADAVMSQLTFDFRILGSEYSAGMVFETMNNRGKPLTLLEKLKNRLMYLVNALTASGGEEAEVLDDEKAALCDDINEAWGKIYRLLASNPQVEPLDEDECVAAHLSVYRAPKESVYSRAVAESRLFKMFCTDAERYPKSERIAETDAAAVAGALKEEKVSIEKIRDYVSDLASFAEAWSRMHDSFSDELGRCRLLSGSQEVKIFLAAVLLHVSDEVMRKSILEKAEQILFRNTIRSVMDEATFATLARRLHGKCLDMLKKGDNEQVDAQGIEDALRSIVEDESRMIDAGTLVEFGAGLMTRQQSPYGFYGWRGLKYFLFNQEGDDGLAWSRFDDATLEHVMPQSSTVDNDDGWWTRQVQQFVTAAGFGTWDALSVREKRACRQCKRNLVNSLGNFVLLTQSENASVSDDPWECYPSIDGVHKEVIGKKAFYADPTRTSSTGARCVARVEGSWNAFQIRERGRGLFRKLAVMLGTTGELDDEGIDLALGFACVKQLEDATFGALPDDDVNRLAPRLGTASEPQQATCQKSDVNAANVMFWEAFKNWCLDNGHAWCEAAIASRGNPYYDPQGGGDCHLFFVFGERSGNVSGNGPLVTVGIYCANGEEQRSQIRSFKGDFDAAFADCPFDFQDWDSGKREAKRILFVRRADYRNPTPELFARMANDYEGVLGVMKRRGFLR